MGFGLILAGKIQVNIGNLITAEAQESLKGDIEAVLHIGRPTYRADLVRHIRPAAIGLSKRKIGVLALGAAVMRRQGIDLGDPREKRHDGGANRPPGAYQITMLQRVLYQLLGRHIDHIILPHDNAGQLQINSVLHDLGQLFPV